LITLLWAQVLQPQVLCMVSWNDTAPSVVLIYHSQSLLLNEVAMSMISERLNLTIGTMRPTQSRGLRACFKLLLAAAVLMFQLVEDLVELQM
jgi:hypothetical protein